MKMKFPGFFIPILLKPYLLIMTLVKNFGESYSSFDHPPLSKYFFGAVLYISDNQFFETRRSLEQKHGRWSYYYQLDQDQIAREFSPYLDRMRGLNIVFTWLTLLVVAWIWYQLTGNGLLSLLLPIALLGNSVFIDSMVRATPDAHYLFFILLSVALCLWYLRHQKMTGLILFSICAGLAIASKLTGLLFIAAYYMYIAVRKLFSIDRKKSLAGHSLLVGLIAFLVWWVINPTIYLRPFKHSAEYLKFRTRQSVVLQRAFPKAALVSFDDKMKSSFCILFDPNCSRESKLGAAFPQSRNKSGAFYPRIYFIYFPRVRKRTKAQNLFIYRDYLCFCFFIPHWNLSTARFGSLLSTDDRRCILG